MGDQFNLFRNSLLAHLKQLADKRNEIVHWNAVHMTGEDDTGGTTSNLVLRPSATWGFDPTGPTLETADLRDFIIKCGFFLHLCSMFHALALRESPDVPAHHRQQWLEIFAQPIEYPPPDGHPSSQQHVARDG